MPSSAPPATASPDVAKSEPLGLSVPGRESAQKARPAVSASPAPQSDAHGEKLVFCFFSSEGNEFSLE